MEKGEERVDEADFFVGDETQSADCGQDRCREQESDIGFRAGLVECYQREG